MPGTTLATNHPSRVALLPISQLKTCSSSISVAKLQTSFLTSLLTPASFPTRSQRNQLRSATLQASRTSCRSTSSGSSQRGQLCSASFLWSATAMASKLFAIPFRQASEPGSTSRVQNVHTAAPWRSSSKRNKAQMAPSISRGPHCMWFIIEAEGRAVDASFDRSET